MASAWADGTTVTLRVPDPGYRLAGVRLSQGHHPDVFAGLFLTRLLNRVCR